MQVKVLPTPKQARDLMKTLGTANRAANRLSELAWEAEEFRRFPLQATFYHQIRDEFPLSAQVVCLIVAKVANAYKLDCEHQRRFSRHGSIAYDSRILSFNLPASIMSIWSVTGRLVIPFVCGEKQRALLAYPRGESDLILRNRKWFLNITVEVPEDKETEAMDVLGVDLGIVEIASDSDGRSYSGAKLNKIRHRNRVIRRKLQKKGTKSAKRLLKKRSRKEQGFARDTNHVVSKSIVQTAKRTNRAIAIEDLNGIRTRVRARRRQRARLHSWSFAQLGGFLRYKAKKAGVKLVEVDLRNTSRRCSKCGHTDKANRKSQSEFVCKKCGHTENADSNGAANIRLKGLTLVGAGEVIRPNAETERLSASPEQALGL